MDHSSKAKRHDKKEFEVGLINGVITSHNLHNEGINSENNSESPVAGNEKYLHAVHSCLGDLFTFIDGEKQSAGHNHACNSNTSDYRQQETTETMLKPLVNYGYPQNLNEAATKKIEMILSDKTADACTKSA